MLLVHLFVCFARECLCPFSSWCRGLAAVCDCGMPWTFLLTCFRMFYVFKNSLVILKWFELNIRRWSGISIFLSCPVGDICIAVALNETSILVMLRNGVNRAYCRVSARLKCQF